MFQIADNKRSFLRNGKPSFYLADTCWSAFTNIVDSDWDYYVDYRKSQGFNVLQINMLQQWDASQTLLDMKPFALKEDGTFDFRNYNEAYFRRAREMVSRAHAKGMTVALVLLWSNYLPDTWASQMPIHQLGIFPKDMVESYVDKVMALMDNFEPIYVISGDTDFQTDEAIHDYYETALNRVKSNNPQALTTLHIRGRENDLPQALKSNPNLDFYMFQSGHNLDFQYMTYTLAEDFYALSPQRPLLNSEPCYELSGYSRRIYGRFSREDVRKAAWQSVLSGGHSGVTYGTNGIWAWHTSQLSFDSSMGEAFETPYDWHDSLHFPGANDYVFIKDIIESKELFDLEPAQDLLVNHSPEIRAAKTDEFLLVYVPSNIKLRLKGDYVAHDMTYIDLENRVSSQATAHFTTENKQTTVDMHRFYRDALLVVEL